MRRQNFHPLGCAENRFYQQGFTLLELMVVLVISAAVLGVAFISIGPARQSAELKNAAREVTSQIMFIRTLSMRDNQEMRFVIHPDTRQYRGEKPNNLDQEAEENDNLISGKLPEDIEVEVYTAASEKNQDGSLGFRFFANGSSTGGYIKLTQDEKSYTIKINWLTGKIVMARDDKKTS